MRRPSSTRLRPRDKLVSNVPSQCGHSIASRSGPYKSGWQSISNIIRNISQHGRFLKRPARPRCSFEFDIIVAKDHALTFTEHPRACLVSCVIGPDTLMKQATVVCRKRNQTCIMILFSQILLPDRSPPAVFLPLKPLKHPRCS